MKHLITLDYEYNRGLFYSTVTRDVNEFNAYVKSHDDVVLVGYNIMVDLHKLGIDRNTVKYIDVYEMFTRFVRISTYKDTQKKLNKNGKPSLKLGDVCKWAGITLVKAHDPRYDAEATLALYHWLVAHGVETRYNQVVNNFKIWA